MPRRAVPCVAHTAKRWFDAVDGWISTPPRAAVTPDSNSGTLRPRVIACSLHGEDHVLELHTAVLVAYLHLEHHTPQNNELSVGVFLRQCHPSESSRLPSYTGITPLPVYRSILA